MCAIATLGVTKELVDYYGTFKGSRFSWQNLTPNSPLAIVNAMAAVETDWFKVITRKARWMYTEKNIDV